MCSSRFLVVCTIRVLSLFPVYVGISCIRVFTSGMRRASSCEGGGGGEREEEGREGGRGRGDTKGEREGGWVKDDTTPTVMML